MKTWDEFYDSLDKRASSAQLIVENTHGELLVVKAYYKPYWSLPGGLVDSGETPVQTALREAHEETGLTFSRDDIRFESVIVRTSQRAITYLFVFRVQTAVDPTIAVGPGDDEIVDYAWVSKSDIHTRADDRHYGRAVKNWASDDPAPYVENVVQ